MQVFGTGFRIGDGKAPAMLQRGNGFARGLDQRGIDLRHEHAGFDAALSQYFAPGGDNQGVPEGLALILVQAGLGCRKNKSAIFDGAGAQERVPMGLAGLPREGGRHGEE